MHETRLRNLSLFAAIAPADLEALAMATRVQRFLPGSILLQEGDEGEHFYILMQGQVEVIKLMGTAEERLVARRGPDDFLGETALLSRERRRSASVRALTAVEALEITQADFEQLLRHQPSVALAIMQEISRRNRASEAVMIQDLRQKNQELAQAYRDLQAAQAQLVRQEIMEHELQLARKIQRDSLPQEPPLPPGWRVGVHWQPARAVGGDFYDFVQHDDGMLSVLVADVTGKGVPAALIMTATRSILRTVIRQSRAPAEVLARANAVLVEETPAAMFVTCLYALLDLETGHMRFANAGHSLPVLRGAQGGVELRARGMPLGTLPGLSYEERETVLEPGDRLLLFSDGVIEAHDPKGQMFGVSRLVDLVAACPPSVDLLAYLLDCLDRFTGPGWEQEDDVSLILLERHLSF